MKKIIWLGSGLGVLVLGLFFLYVFTQHEQTRLANAEPGFTAEQVAYWDALEAHKIKFNLRSENTAKLIESKQNPDELFRSVEDTLALTREVKFIRYPNEYEEIHLAYKEVMARYEKVYATMNAYLNGELEEDPEMLRDELEQLTFEADTAYWKFGKMESKTYVKSGEDLHDDR
ncbi:hypothetical protein CBW65_11985 [Tumebacillus avium]|uniref:Uncharacterized protein n=1 Tax=Tumebacillus avium TaxID=1903704 RepID=A0A1Y0IPB0_9BACL|nr:hypothetical protein [Tumebacillus avium]ARU61656.1 hypothetical protein CBW65_11985 [Tumebacillus avium]